MRVLFLFVFAFTEFVPALAARQGAVAQALANPIRKAVNLLQMMQQKVEAEGAREKELYEKFKCYCQKGTGDLEASIAAASAKMPALVTEIETTEDKLAQIKIDLPQAKKEQAAARESMKEATAIREKEAAAFADEKADYGANIDAINRAVAALEKGAYGSFLQSNSARVLHKLALGKTDMLDADRQELLAFLTAGGHAQYAPKSPEVIGILKQMGDTMAKNLKEATDAEEAAIKAFEELMAAKTKEVEALQVAIEEKLKLIGELGIKIVQMKGDLSDTEAGLLEDKKFLAALKTDCATKDSEWEERAKIRAEELLAIAETIKILNNDDALELFKKTLPSSSSSFVQLRAGAASMRARAMTVLRESWRAVHPGQRTGLDLLLLALNGHQAQKASGFEKIIKLIDDMVVLLKKEQTDDDDKKGYCLEKMDLADDKKKALGHSLEDQDNAIASAKEGLATLTDEIASLEASIVALDKSVAEATAQRKSEHTEFKDLMASDAAAKDLIMAAKNRLNKFYSPKLYIPKKVELSEEDRIMKNMGMDVGQVSLHQQQKDAPPPPPETWDAYAKKTEEGAGVIALLDLLVKDLDKEMTVAETEESNAQMDYQALMQDSAGKRAVDSKTLSDKVAAKAELGAMLAGHEEAKAATTKELEATLKYIASLHAECDWLLQYFDVRKEARTGEIESLEKAKAILSGASFEFIQVAAQKGSARRAPCDDCR